MSPKPYLYLKDVLQCTLIIIILLLVVFMLFHDNLAFATSLPNIDKAMDTEIFVNKCDVSGSC